MLANADPGAPPPLIYSSQLRSPAKRFASMTSLGDFFPLISARKSSTLLLHHILFFYPLWSTCPQFTAVQHFPSARWSIRFGLTSHLVSECARKCTIVNLCKWRGLVADGSGRSWKSGESDNVRTDLSSWLSKCTLQIMCLNFWRQFQDSNELMRGR